VGPLAVVLRNSEVKEERKQVATTTTAMEGEEEAKKRKGMAASIITTAAISVTDAKFGGIDVSSASFQTREHSSGITAIALLWSWCCRRHCQAQRLPHNKQ
jgi:hypothetical protein